MAFRPSSACKPMQGAGPLQTAAHRVPLPLLDHFVAACALFFNAHTQRKISQTRAATPPVRISLAVTIHAYLISRNAHTAPARARIDVHARRRTAQPHATQTRADACASRRTHSHALS
eukprot:6198124-Pleurochrysis_carterae.AAC.4